MAELGRGVPRLQLGREALLFLGFPLQHIQPLLDRTSEALLQDLAGNAMALPVLLAILMSTFASVSWRTGASAADAPASSTEEVTAALAMFDRLARAGPEKMRIHPCGASWFGCTSGQALSGCKREHVPPRSDTSPQLDRNLQTMMHVGSHLHMLDPSTQDTPLRDAASHFFVGARTLHIELN